MRRANPDSVCPVDKSAAQSVLHFWIVALTAALSHFFRSGSRRAWIVGPALLQY